MIEEHKKRPKIAVLLAVYNGEKFLLRQVKSILCQKNVDISIYLNLDKSNDNSSLMCEKLSKENDNIYFLNQNNVKRFGSAAKNFFNMILNINFNNYEYISFSDQDDIWKPFKLITGILNIQKNDVSGYSSNVRPFYKKKILTLVDKSRPQTKYDYFFEGGGAGSTYIIKSLVAKKLQQYLGKNRKIIEEFNHHDWFIYAFTRFFFGKWYIDKNSYVYYRQHSQNELGTSLSFRGIFKRAIKILNGYALGQSQKLAQFLKCKDTIIKKLLFHNNISGLYQIYYFKFLRRSYFGKIAMIFVGLISIFKLNN